PEAVRAIKEDSPSSLSTIDRTYRGDLDTIVNKSLEKDPARRYSTAADFAQDVRRYLKDEPIVARPPSTWYELSKFAKRNKAVVAGVVVAFVALTAGLVASLWQASEATRARDEAVESQKNAEESLDVASELNSFLESLLASPDPYQRLGQNV